MFHTFFIAFFLKNVQISNFHCYSPLPGIGYALEDRLKFHPIHLMSIPHLLSLYILNIHILCWLHSRPATLHFLNSQRSPVRCIIHSLLFIRLSLRMENFVISLSMQRVRDSDSCSHDWGSSKLGL